MAVLTNNGARYEVDAAYINGYTAFTFSVWIKSNVTNTDKGFNIGGNPNGSDRWLSFRYDASGASGGGTNLIKFGIEISGIEDVYETTNNVQTTNLQHLVCTWISGDPLEVWINGQKDTPTFISPARSGSITGMTTLNIGRGAKFNDGSGGGWNGVIDDYRIYNRKLSDNEILNIYNTRGCDGIVNGLTMKYLFNDRTNSDAIDLSVENRNAAAVLGPNYTASELRYRKRFA
jgi:hypothetical protein